MMQFLHRLLLFLLFLGIVVETVKVPNVKKEAVVTLVTQFVQAFGKYMEIKCFKNQTVNKARGVREKVKLLVWDSFGEAEELIQDMANEADKPNETVIVANDIGEDPKSRKMKKIVKKIKKKKPKAQVISIDWSQIVSGNWQFWKPF